eukprot:3627032-Pyramimonas_sp.AAC.1
MPAPGIKPIGRVDQLGGRVVRSVHTAGAAAAAAYGARAHKLSVPPGALSESARRFDAFAVARLSAVRRRRRWGERIGFGPVSPEKTRMKIRKLSLEKHSR